MRGAVVLLFSSRSQADKALDGGRLSLPLRRHGRVELAHHALVGGQWPEEGAGAGRPRDGAWPAARTRFDPPTDHGCQCRPRAFEQRCREAGAVNGLGDYYENTTCESFFAPLECELLDRPRFRTHLDACGASLEYIERGTIRAVCIPPLATSHRLAKKGGIAGRWLQGSHISYCPPNGGNSTVGTPFLAWEALVASLPREFAIAEPNRDTCRHVSDPRKGLRKSSRCAMTWLRARRWPCADIIVVTHRCCGGTWVLMLGPLLAIFAHQQASTQSAIFFRRDRHE